MNNESNLLIERYVLKYFSYDKDEIKIEHGDLRIHKTHKIKNPENFYNTNNYSDSLIIFWIGDNSEYEVDIQLSRFVSNKNIENFLYKSNIVNTFIKVLDEHKDEIKKEHGELTETYQILFNKLEVIETGRKIVENKELLVKIEEDLLLETGNVYKSLGRKLEYRITGRDGDDVFYVKWWDNSGEWVSTPDRRKETISIESIIKEIKEKSLIPNKVTERKIKLKRILYV